MSQLLSLVGGPVGDEYWRVDQDPVRLFDIKVRCLTRSWYQGAL